MMTRFVRFHPATWEPQAGRVGRAKLSGPAAERHEVVQVEQVGPALDVLARLAEFAPGVNPRAVFGKERANGAEATALF